MDRQAPPDIPPPPGWETREGPLVRRTGLEATTFVAMDVLSARRAPAWEERRAERQKNPPTPTASIAEADAMRTRRGRPQWRIRLEKQAIAAGRPPAEAQADVVQLTLIKGRAGHRYTPDADAVREALAGTVPLTPEQKRDLDIYLHEASAEVMREGWLNGEINLADVARRGVELYGREVLTYVPGIDVITSETTGTSAWKL